MEDAQAEARRKREEAAARAVGGGVSRSTGSGSGSCRPRSEWTSAPEVIYTDTQGILLQCQDSSGKSCVEGAMNRAGQFTMFGVAGMARSCCCALLD